MQAAMVAEVEAIVGAMTTAAVASMEAAAAAMRGVAGQATVAQRAASQAAVRGAARDNATIQQYNAKRNAMLARMDAERVAKAGTATAKINAINAAVGAEGVAEAKRIGLQQLETERLKGSLLISEQGKYLAKMLAANTAFGAEQREAMALVNAMQIQEQKRLNDILFADERARLESVAAMRAAAAKEAIAQVEAQAQAQIAAQERVTAAQIAASKAAIVAGASRVATAAAAGQLATITAGSASLSAREVAEAKRVAAARLAEFTKGERARFAELQRELNREIEANKAFNAQDKALAKERVTQEILILNQGLDAQLASLKTFNAEALFLLESRLKAETALMRANQAAAASAAAGGRVAPRVTSMAAGLATVQSAQVTALAAQQAAILDTMRAADKATIASAKAASAETLREYDRRGRERIALLRKYLTQELGLERETNAAKKVEMKRLIDQELAILTEGWEAIISGQKAADAARVASVAAANKAILADQATLAKRQAALQAEQAALLRKSGLKAATAANAGTALSQQAIMRGYNRESFRAIRQTFQQQGVQAGTAFRKGVANAARNATFGVAGIGLLATYGTGKAFQEYETNQTKLDTALGKGLNKIPADVKATIEAANKKIGLTTKFAAQDAQAAAIEGALAGLDTNSLYGNDAAGVKNLMEFAEVAGLDIPTAVKQASSAFNVWRDSTGDLKSTLDILGGAASASSANIADLALGTQNAGPIIANSGTKFSEFAATLALLSNSGTPPSMAGISMRQTYTLLRKPTKAIKDVQKNYGINFYDTKGQAKTIPELRKTMQGLTDMQINQVQAAFGTRAGQFLTILAKTTDEAWSQMMSDVETPDALTKLSDAWVGPMQLAWKKLTATMKTVSVDFFASLAPYVSGLADSLKGIGEWFAGVAKADPEKAQKIAAAVVAISLAAPALWLTSLFTAPLTGALAFISNTAALGRSRMMLAGIAAEQRVIAAASTTANASQVLLQAQQARLAAGGTAALAAGTGLRGILGLGGLGAGLSAIGAAAAPIAAVAAAIAAVAAVVVGAWQNSDKLREAVGQLGETFGKLGDRVGPAISGITDGLITLWNGAGGEALRSVLSLIGDVLSIGVKAIDLAINVVVNEPAAEEEGGIWPWVKKWLMVPAMLSPLAPIIVAFKLATDETPDAQALNDQGILNGKELGKRLGAVNVPISIATEIQGTNPEVRKVADQLARDLGVQVEGGQKGIEVAINFVKGKTGADQAAYIEEVKRGFDEQEKILRAAAAKAVADAPEGGKEYAKAWGDALIATGKDQAKQFWDAIGKNPTVTTANAAASAKSLVASLTIPTSTVEKNKATLDQMRKDLGAAMDPVAFNALVMKWRALPAEEGAAAKAAITAAVQGGDQEVRDAAAKLTGDAKDALIENWKKHRAAIEKAFQITIPPVIIEPPQIKPLGGAGWKKDSKGRWQPPGGKKPKKEDTNADGQVDAVDEITSRTDVLDTQLNNANYEKVTKKLVDLGKTEIKVPVTVEWKGDDEWAAVVKLITETMQINVTPDEAIKQVDVLKQAIIEISNIVPIIDLNIDPATGKITLLARQLAALEPTKISDANAGGTASPGVQRRFPAGGAFNPGEAGPPAGPQARAPFAAASARAGTPDISMTSIGGSPYEWLNKAAQAAKALRIEIEKIADAHSAYADSLYETLRSQTKLTELAKEESSKVSAADKEAHAADLLKAQEELAKVLKDNKATQAEIAAAKANVSQAKEQISEDSRGGKDTRTPAAMGKRYDQAAKQATAFAAKIASLKKKGASDALLKDLLSLDPKDAAVLAGRILKGGKKGVKDASKKATRSDKAARAAADAIADTLDMAAQEAKRTTYQKAKDLALAVGEALAMGSGSLKRAGQAGADAWKDWAKNLNNLIDDSELGKKARKRLKDMVESKRKEVEDLTKRLKNFEEAVAFRDTFKETLKTGMNWADYFNVTDMVEQINRLKTQAINNSANLQLLRNEGFDPEMLKQIQQLPQDQQGILLNQLATATPEQKAQIKAAFADMMTVDAAVADQVAATLYAESAEAAGRGFAEGIEKEKANIEAMLSELAQFFAAEMADALKQTKPKGSKSQTPTTSNTPAPKAGSFTPMGMAAAVPYAMPNVDPGGGTASGGGGVTVVQNISAAPGMDTLALAHQVGRRISWELGR